MELDPGSCGIRFNLASTGKEKGTDDLSVIPCHRNSTQTA